MAILPPMGALGTQFLIEIWDEVNTAKLEAVHGRLEFLLSEFENNYSRFKPDSHISRLNQEKSIKNPSPALVALLNQGINLYDTTGGILNLMIGEKIVALGYDANYSFTPKETPPVIPNPHDVLTVTPEKITLTAGLIDIGGYGKGVAIDLVATLLQSEFGLQYFLVNGGGDMFGTSDHGAPITIYLEHPTEAETYLGTTTILNQGFAASSRHKRSWVHNHTTYSHIIETDTQQMLPRQIDASFITTTTATTADVFATVALIASPNLMTEFATTHELGVATFSLPSSLMHNQAFLFENL